jgi:hypothetical protein
LTQNKLFVFASRNYTNNTSHQSNPEKDVGIVYFGACLNDACWFAFAKAFKFGSAKVISGTNEVAATKNLLSIRYSFNNHRISLSKICWLLNLCSFVVTGLIWHNDFGGVLNFDL